MLNINKFSAIIYIRKIIFTIFCSFIFYEQDGILFAILASIKNKLFVSRAVEL